MLRFVAGEALEEAQLRCLQFLRSDFNVLLREVVKVS
jgi:hypothetical protein